METKLEWFLTSMTWIFTALQDNEIWQNIQFILSITSTILVLALTIYKFIRKAASDGKIDAEEIEEGIEILKDGVEELQEKIEGGNKDAK